MLDDILLAVGSGGLSGLVGGIMNRFADYKLEKIRFQHESARNDHELKVIQLEAEANLKIMREKGKIDVSISENEMEADIAQAQAKSLAASYANDARSYSTNGESKWFVFVDVWRGIIRPGITTYYSIVSTIITWYLYQMVKDVITDEKAMELFEYVVILMVYMTATATLYWFATRVKAPRGL